MTPSAFLQINQRLKKEYILLFDFDDTLLDTNLANNEAYKYALWKVTGKSDYIQLANARRITRKDIAKLPDITPQMVETIVQEKKNNYRYKITYTAPYITHEILKRHSAYTPCYVITTADKERVQQLDQYYQLGRFVKDYLFVDEADKYKNIARRLNVEPSQIILFEDKEEAINNAIKNGILQENIIPVLPNTLKKQLIWKNNFLSQNIISYYSLDYVRFGNPNNPDFINTLKNQYCSCSQEALVDALNVLRKYLVRDICSIFNMMHVEELVVVAIPRSKEENEYIPEQQLFRRGIQEAVKFLREDNKLNIIDGSHFISRHTNTKTTHLSKNDNVENDGAMPYVGITKDTCTISHQVAGKDILLIDDIYTLDVNIDEDAIQALYDMGAKSVRFYSVCRTVKVKKRQA